MNHPSERELSSLGPQTGRAAIMSAARCNSFVAVGVGVAAAGASVYAANKSSKSSDKASKQNRNAQKYAADLNYQQFRESRGDGGSAVLPLYLKSASGGLFEKALGQDLTDAYDVYHQDPTAVADYQTRVDAFNPAIAGARKTTNDIFDGGLENRLVTNFKPVASARVKFKRASAIDALNKTLQEINAVQSGRGYSGDSMGNRLLQFQARKSAGDEVAGANIQNAEEERAIRDMALQVQLQNLGLPYQQARNDLELFRLPQDNYIAELLKEQQPFNFLRIGVGQPPAVQPLRYEANPSTGQLAAQGIGQLSGAALNYYMQQKQQQDYLDRIAALQRTQATAPAYGGTIPNVDYSLTAPGVGYDVSQPQLDYAGGLA